MSLARLVRLGSILPWLVAALCAACGSDVDNAAEGGTRPEREGPAGCYIGAERLCDCDIEEAACVEEGQTWVEEGCASCAA